MAISKPSDPAAAAVAAFKPRVKSPAPAPAPAPKQANPKNVAPMIKQTKTANGLPISQTAESLYIDPTPIYQPALDFIAQQRTQANERYAQNKADISNIFGTLTTMRQADAEKIRKQFENSITSQQTALATRTAEARRAQEAAGQAYTQVGAERGGGPEVAGIAAPQTALAAEQGIADANAIQGAWEGMQRAMGSQAQVDLSNAIAGYGFQEAQSVRDLQGSLENTLNQLAGQQIDVNTALAEAIYGGRSKVAEANYNEILAKQAAEEARRLAAIRGAYSVEQAKIDAASKLALAKANAESRVTNYENDALGISRRLADFGEDPSAFWGSIDAIDTTGFSNAGQAYKDWVTKNPRTSQAAKDAARDWFNTQRYQTATVDYAPYLK